MIIKVDLSHVAYPYNTYKVIVNIDLPHSA